MFITEKNLFTLDLVLIYIFIQVVIQWPSYIAIDVIQMTIVV